MSQLKFSDLIETPVPLSPAEVVALTLAVADVLAERSRSDLPPDNAILLSSTGQVSIESVSERDDEDTGQSTVAQLASLTRRLLQLDKVGSVDRRKRVPSPLLGTLARALTKADLPAPTPEEFRQSLERFGKPEPTALAAVFWRAARLCTPMRVALTTLPPVKVESALAHRGAEDRRHNLPPPSDLRRYLRETERELFEARAHPERRRPAASVERTPAVAPEKVVDPVPVPAAVVRKQPFYNTRLWRVSAGIAAKVVGAVLGTLIAFFLAGSPNQSQEQQVASINAPPPAAAPAASLAPQSESNVAQAAQSERPIRVERTVQPMLLAAAVGADVFSPSFAPRGKTILFHAGREASPLMRASVSDTGTVDQIETLLDDGATNYHVTMSPDGARIAYDSDRDGVRGVYVANANGSSPRRISGNGYAAVPSWSPDGGRVAFVRAEPGRTHVWNVWFADVRSGQLRRVTNHSVGQPWGASWFPDGQRIAYSLEDRLMVADLRDGLARGYRSPRAGRLVRTPAVSPDGKRIVFQVQEHGVWLLDMEHARMRRILDDKTAEEFVWSPDGGAIAYHARKGGSYGLWRLAVSPAGN